MTTQRKPQPRKATSNVNNQNVTLGELNAMFSTFKESLLSELSSVLKASVSIQPEKPSEHKQTSKPKSSKPQPRETIQPNKPSLSKGHNKSEFEPIEILITDTALRNRIKFPARLFDNRTGIAYINGEKFIPQPNDQNRSTKVSPAHFNAKLGQTIIVTKDDGSINKFTLEVKGKGTTQKTQPQETASKPEKRANRIPSITQKAQPTKGHKKETIETVIESFAERCFENYGNKSFKTRDKLSNLGLENDARTYLSTRQHFAFKAKLKEYNVRLKDGTEMLNELVF